MVDFSLHDHVAILIDVDNAQSYINQVLKIAEYYGKLVICRAYGDWEMPNLFPWCEKLDALKIDRIQVDRVGKNASDHRLLVEAGEILGNSNGLLGEEVDVFIIVSGDGGFASSCQFIRERGKRVVGIGNQKHTSDDLRNSCNDYLYLEDLEDELSELERRYSIPPNEVRSFSTPLLFAFHQLTKKEYEWVPCSQLEAKLRQMNPDYESKFGKYELSEWLRYFELRYETRDQMIRMIDPNPEQTRRDRIVGAYLETKRPDGLAPLAEIGKMLRTDPYYEIRFGGKKLSEWIKEYPDEFEIRGNDVIHQRYLEE